MPNLPDSMAENTKNCFSSDDVLAIFSNIDADLQSLGPSCPALSSGPEVIILSAPKSPIYLTNPASIDEQDSFDSTSAIEDIWPFVTTLHPSLSDQLDPQKI